jgi:hypothetical protein
MAAERPASARTGTLASDWPRQDLAETPARDAEDARLISRAKRQALWLMAGSCLVTVAIVAGI